MDNKSNSQTKVIVLLSVILVALLIGTGVLTWKYKTGANNSVIIYYVGFTTPYIDYRIGAEGWLGTPGKALEKNTDTGKGKDDFTHKIMIPLGQESKIIAKFNDGKGSIQDNSGRNYELKKGTYYFRDGRMISEEQVGKFNIVGFKVEPNAISVSTGTEVKLSVSTLGGASPIAYKFTAMDASGTETIIRDFEEGKSTAIWKPDMAGNYKLVAIARDKNGKEVESQIEGFKVISLTIKDINTSEEAPQKPGTTIALSMELDNPAKLDVKCRYEITKEGEEPFELEATTMGAADWEPSEAGKYTIKAIAESGDMKAEKTIEYEIEEEKNQQQVTIYYHAYVKYDIEYGQVSEGASYNDVTLTGDSMQQDSSVPGFEYKYTASVDEGNVLVVSFRNATDGSEDNNNGKFYVLKPGTYGIKDGMVYSLGMNNQNINNNNNNQSMWGQWNWNSYNNSGNNDDDYDDENDNKKNGTVKVYYKEREYKYIHYQVGNGQWKQEEMKNSNSDGYKRKFEISLNGASYIKAYFSDGKAKIDNNKGANYTLNAGKYYINYGIQKYEAD